MNFAAHSAIGSLGVSALIFAGCSSDSPAPAALDVETLEPAVVAKAPASAVPNLMGDAHRNYRTIGGVIRNTGGGWGFVAGSHATVGLAVPAAGGLDARNKQIRVDYAFVAKNVVTFVCTPDETLAVEGYTCGASVGLDHASISIGRPKATGGYERVDPAKLVTASGNFWLYGLMEI